MSPAAPMRQPPADRLSTDFPVVAAPFADPGRGRIDFMVPAGTTVGEVVSLALPGATDAQLGRARVALSTPAGVWIVERSRWHLVRPKPGAKVVVRVVPASDELRSILSVVVGIAATALGQLWLGPLIAPLFGVSTELASSVATLALTAIGGLLLNALIPAQKDDQKEKPNYAISGWQNGFTPDGTVPAPLGRHRYAPPFAAGSWTEIVGGEMYIRAEFCLGYGPLAISEQKIGDTPLDEYDEVDIEFREGYPDDEPLSLYTQQIVEEQLRVELRRDYPRDDYGEVIPGEEAEEDPIVRYTAADASEAAVIIGWPAGLVFFNEDGERALAYVTVRIRQRPAGSEAGWTDVETLEIAAKTTEGFFRQHRWTLPSRGRWEVQLTRMDPESVGFDSMSDRTVWMALQSIRPEYPLNFTKPLALAAVRIRATHQLNGQLDSFNVVLSRIAPDWNGSAWLPAETRNPAALVRWMLQGPAAQFPVADAELDLDGLADWHEFCTAKGLKYDRIHDFSGSMLEQLQTVAAAGRASMRHDGRRWTVVIDRPQTLPIDHVNPRNSRQFQWTHRYFEPPHAFRVSFIDATNEWQSGERLVPWPGHEGEITITEQLDLPGKTDPDEIWIEARRRQYELIHRASSFSAIQDGAARVATRGDLVMLSTDTLDDVQRAARVVSVRDNAIELDGEVTMEAGGAYACRFRLFSAEDTIGESVVRQVVTIEGTSKLIVLAGAGSAPERGSILTFGLAGSDSFPVLVRAIEPGEDFASVLTMIPAAPIIDQLTDAEEPPAWNGRVGGEIDPSALVPAAPRVVGASSGLAGTGVLDGLLVLLAPGLGSAALVGSFEVRARLDGAGTWDETVSAPAGSGTVWLPDYAYGADVEFEARAISVTGVAGPWTATLSATVGEDDVVAPRKLDFSDRRNGTYLLLI